MVTNGATTGDEVMIGVVVMLIQPQFTANIAVELHAIGEIYPIEPPSSYKEHGKLSWPGILTMPPGIETFIPAPQTEHGAYPGLGGIVGVCAEVMTKKIAVRRGTRCNAFILD